MLWDKYCQSYDGAASEVDDIVDCDHLQVQHHLPGSLDGTRQDECGTHVTGLLLLKEGRQRVRNGNDAIWQLRKMEEEMGLFVFTISTQEIIVPFYMISH